MRVRKTTEQDVLLYRAPVGSLLELQQHADFARSLACAERRQRATAETHLPLRGRCESRECVYQRSLAGAVAAEYRPHFRRSESHRQIAAQGAARYRQRHRLAREHQRRRLRRTSIAGTPMSAVKMPMGNFCGDHTVRAAVSAIVISEPPRSTASGSSARWLATPVRRMAWGAMSPMKPIAPPVITAATVAIAAARNVKIWSGATAMPSERAFNSPSASRSSCAPVPIASTSKVTSAMPAPSAVSVCDRSPISQNSMPRTCASGASTSVRLMSAESPDDNTTPVSSSRYVFQSPERYVRPNTTTIANTAPASADRFIAIAPVPAASASKAPRDAPPDTPSTYGSPSAFLSRTCSSVPASARSPPHANAANARGARNSHITS